MDLREVICEDQRWMKVDHAKLVYTETETSDFATRVRQVSYKN